MSDQARRTAMIEPRAQAIRCARCALPSVEIRAGMLIVRNKHHGQTHENTFSLAWLKEQIERESRSNESIRDAA